MTNLDSILKSRDITLPTKVHIVKAMVFPVVMYRCESWTIKKAECRKIWCFRTVVLENTLESPLDCKEIKPVYPKGNHPLNIHWKVWCWSWNSNTLVIWCKEPVHLKRPDVRKDWAQEEKQATEDAMAGWHQQLDGQEFEQAQGSLASCSSWGHRESDTTWRLNNTWPGWCVRGKSWSLRLILIKNGVPLNIRHLSRHCRNNKIK